MGIFIFGAKEADPGDSSSQRRNSSQDVAQLGDTLL